MDLHFLTHSFHKRRSSDLKRTIEGKKKGHERNVERKRVQSHSACRRDVVPCDNHRRLFAWRRPAQGTTGGPFRDGEGSGGKERDRRSCHMESQLFQAGLRHKRCSVRSEEHTSELQSLMRISYAVFCLIKKT